MVLIVLLILIGLFIVILLSELDHEKRSNYLEKTTITLKNLGKNFVSKLLKHLANNEEFPPYAIILTILLFFALIYRLIFKLLYYLANILKYATLKSANRRHDWPI
jgi:hypothetical protein